MDARIDVLRGLGLEIGDAHIIRNAGCVITDDVIRSLTVSQRFGGTRSVILLNHTDCAMLKVPEGELGAFTDMDAHIRESVASIKGSPLLRGTTTDVRAFVYDVATDTVREAA